MPARSLRRTHAHERGFARSISDRSASVRVLCALLCLGPALVWPGVVEAGPGACTPVGASLLCAGDQSGGVSAADFTPPGSSYTTVVVNALTTDIAPAAKVPGVVLLSVGAGPVAVSVDAGPYQIIAGKAPGIAVMGDSVDVVSVGNILTTGPNKDPNTLGAGILGAYGIFAASAAGPVTVRSTGTVATTGNDAAGILAAGLGGDAIVSSTGNISTAGKNAHGLYALSAGGAASVTSLGNITTQGGQAAGIAVTADGNASATSTGTISTSGNGATGIYVNSTSGTATVISTGDIFTTGNGAKGIDAATCSCTGDAAIVTSTGNVTTHGKNAVGISADANLGQASVTSVGNIVTTGLGSDGILARSASAAASIASTGNVTTSSDNAVGLHAVSGADKATVTSTGNISTAGKSSYGIFARSNGGDATAVSNGSIQTTGDSATGIRVRATGDATAVSNGSISVSGASAAGISARSTGGAVSITTTGNVFASAADASAIRANAATSATVTVNGGTVAGGSGLGAGVRFLGTGTNSLINSGTVTSLAGLAGNAIVAAGSGDTTVTNLGTVTGLVDFASGANAFNNMAGGLFNTGATVTVGAGNALTNAGTLSPGGTGVIQLTSLTGNLVQTGTGRYAVDLNMAGVSADKMLVTGTASLAGTVFVRVQDPVLTTQSVTILSAAGGATNAGLTATPASPAIQAQVQFPNATDVVLGVTVDFAARGLNENQLAIANNLNAILNAGSGGLGPVINGLLNVPSLGAYQYALDQLSPQIYLQNQLTSLFSSLGFSNALMSCKVANGAHAFIAEGQCVWAQVNARSLRREETSNAIGFKEEAEQVAGGAQLRIAPDWHLGIALGYEHSATASATVAHASGDRAQGGVALKYTSGPMLFAAALSGGQGWYDTSRPMSFGGFSAVATSSSDVAYLGGKLRAAYLLDHGDWYLKPLVDLNVVRLWQSAVTEIGAGAASLLVASSDKTWLSISPALELGTQWPIAQAMSMRPYVRVGATLFDDPRTGAVARFAGAPTGIPGFSATAAIDRAVADISVGAEIFAGNSSALRLSYDGQFGDTTHQQSFGARASFKF